MARTASGIGSAFEAELWASHLLGTFAAQRFDLPFPEGASTDTVLMYGEPLVRQLARLEEPGAAIALAAIAELDEGELGLQARELLDSASLRRRLPAWVAEVGESEIIGAAVMRDLVFDDGRTVFLESRYVDGTTVAVGVLIDSNLGGMAKDVLLAESIDQVEAAMREHAGEGGDDDAGELTLERIAPGIAAGLIGEAISLTDLTWDPPVLEDYWTGRALAQLRADQTPHVVKPQERERVPDERRDALRDEFLGSPEGAGFAPDGDEAWVAVLAIDFGCDYAGGDPLRWSPAVVELFMLSWVPRKVMTTPAMLKALPGALDAWVRFAARKRGVPDGALGIVREAIEHYAAEMVEVASDPEAGGASKQFLQAALQAGVDLGDEEAVGAFIAGWNARSGLEVDAAGSSGGRAASAGMGLAGRVVQVKVALLGVTKPPVWRRLQVAADTRLDEFHGIIQAAFGWYDSHLHVFEAGEVQFGPVDDGLELDFLDERDYTVAELLDADGERVIYTYDFGDDWRHQIVLEEVGDPEPGVAYPLLVTAKGACPPEDCGGAWRYQDLKLMLAEPGDDRGEAEELRGWLDLEPDEQFDPKAVDQELIRHRLSAFRPRG